MTPWLGASAVLVAGMASLAWRAWLRHGIDAEAAPPPGPGRRSHHAGDAPALGVLLDELARRCRSGSSVRAAVLDTGPTGDPTLDAALTAVQTQLHAGAPLEVVAALAGGDRTVGAAWTLATSGAADPAAALGGAATRIFEREALRREVRALTAGPRWSAVVVAALPLLFAVWAVVADPSALAVLVQQPVGRVCLVVGVTLDVVGAWWMHRLVRSVA